MKMTSPFGLAAALYWDLDMRQWFLRMPGGVCYYGDTPEEARRVMEKDRSEGGL